MFPCMESLDSFSPSLTCCLFILSPPHWLGVSWFFLPLTDLESLDSFSPSLTWSLLIFSLPYWLYCPLFLACHLGCIWCPHWTGAFKFLLDNQYGCIHILENYIYEFVFTSSVVPSIYFLFHIISKAYYLKWSCLHFVLNSWTLFFLHSHSGQCLLLLAAPSDTTEIMLAYVYFWEVQDCLCNLYLSKLLLNIVNILFF